MASNVSTDVEHLASYNIASDIGSATSERTTTKLAICNYLASEVIESIVNARQKERTGRGKEQRYSNNS